MQQNFWRLNRVSNYLVLTVFILFLQLGCTNKDSQKKITPAAYHWKTILQPTLPEKKVLAETGINTIYLHLFDVAWNALTSSPLPIAKVILKDTAFLKGKTIIPTVFITDECIFRLDSNAVQGLADNISAQVELLMSQLPGSHFSQVQIDCDWTKTTKEKYFRLLQSIKANNKDKILSVTLRLHQVKYWKETGIPPADRVMLMCYNMGNLRNPDIKNSILDVEELKKYISDFKQYPVPADIALPIFEWIVLFRKNTFAGLVEDDLDKFLLAGLMQNKNSYIVQKDTTINGISLKANDVLRYETSETSTLKKLLQTLKPILKRDSFALTFYHIDAVTLKKHTSHELESLFSILR